MSFKRVLGEYLKRVFVNIQSFNWLFVLKYKPISLDKLLRNMI